MRVAPEHARARLELSRALLDAGRIPEALNELRAAARIEPHNAEIRRRLEEAEAVLIGAWASAGSMP